jgi:hypothetical protein
MTTTKRQARAATTKGLWRGAVLLLAFALAGVAVGATRPISYKRASARICSGFRRTSSGS